MIFSKNNKNFKELINQNKILLFVGKISFFCKNQKLPQYTIEELAVSTNPQAKDEKSAAHGLLDFALKSFGIDYDFSKLKKIDGKPYSPDFQFSYSHSCDLVSLAVSKNNIGVDIEFFRKNLNLNAFKKHICNEKEGKKVRPKISTLTKLWTKKEACFKLLGGKAFIPNQITLKGKYFKTFKINYGKKYYMTICSDIKQKVIFFNFIDTRDLKKQEKS